MNIKQILFFLCITLVNVYSLEVSIIDISQNDKTIQIDVEIFSSTIILLPENLFSQKISTDTNVFTENQYQIFYAFLIKSALRNGRFILALSNENLGIVSYFGRLQAKRLTAGINYLPFIGKKGMSIIIDKIEAPYIIGQDRFIMIEQDYYNIDEIFLSICYANVRLNDPETHSRITEYVIFFENLIKIASVTYRLSFPLTLSVEDLYTQW